MCDYSLHHVASRPAKVGDKLVTTQFPASSTRGLAAVGEPNVAVCLRPGTELAFTEDVKYDHPLTWLLPGFRFRSIGSKTARFRQVNVTDPGVHHDALEFANGAVVLLTRLRTNQHATVLQLPAEVHALEEREAQKRPLLIP